MPDCAGAVLPVESRARPHRLTHVKRRRRMRIISAPPRRDVGPDRTTVALASSTRALECERDAPPPLEDLSLLASTAPRIVGARSDPVNRERYESIRW